MEAASSTEPPSVPMISGSSSAASTDSRPGMVKVVDIGLDIVVATAPIPMITIIQTATKIGHRR